MTDISNREFYNREMKQHWSDFKDDIWDIRNSLGVFCNSHLLSQIIFSFIAVTFLSDDAKKFMPQEMRMADAIFNGSEANHNNIKSVPKLAEIEEYNNSSKGIIKDIQNVSNDALNSLYDNGPDIAKICGAASLSTAIMNPSTVGVSMIESIFSILYSTIVASYHGLQTAVSATEFGACYLYDHLGNNGELEVAGESEPANLQVAGEAD
ncbi:MAG TPA: hypothetical protein QKA08_01010 [Candidatus Megaira endosymbiont of Nemacystus decipiens]|nr:hypothetical protein [Candidatus Megaera endosymbiont of Nemacystus decipiens]